jgi:hypothetical protein
LVSSTPSISLPSNPIVQQLSIHIIVSSTCTDAMHSILLTVYHSPFLSSSPVFHRLVSLLPTYSTYVSKSIFKWSPPVCDNWLSFCCF